MQMTEKYGKNRNGGTQIIGMEEMKTKVLRHYVKEPGKELWATAVTLGGVHMIDFRHWYMNEPGSWTPDDEGITIEAKIFRVMVEAFKPPGEPLKSIGLKRITEKLISITINGKTHTMGYEMIPLDKLNFR